MLLFKRILSQEQMAQQIGRENLSLLYNLSSAQFTSAELYLFSPAIWHTATCCCRCSI